MALIIPVDEARGGFSGAILVASSNLAASNLIEAYGTNGADLGHFNTNTGLGEPVGAVLDASANVYLLGYSGYGVAKYSPVGSLVNPLFITNGLEGHSGSLGANCLAIDATGDFYVANYGDSAVLKYDSSGKSLGVFTASGISVPVGLAFDSSNNLYVANLDPYPGDVTVYSSNGTLLRTVACYEPCSLAVDQSGNLYIGMNSTGILWLGMDAQVAKVTPSGVVSILTNVFNAPCAIQVDVAGNVWVDDEAVAKMYEYAPSGALITNFAIGTGYSTFVLVPSPPTVGTASAVVISPISVVINCTLNPERLATQVWLEWGTSTNYGNTAVPQSLGSGAIGVSVSQILGDLTAGTPYYCRAVASNAEGITYGANLSFHTAIIAWTNLSGGFWSDTNNWDPNRVPTNSDNVLLTADGTYAVIVDLPYYLNPA